MPPKIDVALAPDAPTRGGPIPSRELRALVRAAVRATLTHCAVARAEISVTLLGDEGITDLNRRFLERDRPTDVIAFPLYEAGETPVGDVYLGLAQAYRQADSLRVTPREEVFRIAVHGTLHVLGYDHPEGEDRMRSEMWSEQEAIIAEALAP